MLGGNLGRANHDFGLPGQSDRLAAKNSGEKSMKCVVGVDLESRSLSVIGLLGSLRLDIEETLLLHVTESMDLSVPKGVNGLFSEVDTAYEALVESSKNALTDAERLANQLDLHPRIMLADGFPSTSLTKFAYRSGARLIAVTSMLTGPFDAVFNESVARGLALSAHQSVLIARKDTHTNGPIRAVFASDQSAYCEECAKLLVAFRPLGISHLTLLTVHDQDRHAKHELDSGIANSPVSHENLHKAMIEKGDLMARWLSRHAIPTESRIESGGVNKIIRQVMQDTKADLLIVGARGHSLIQRLLLGSTALHEVVGEPFPVLLLRPS
jgi:nucleotide-binding universal stress UspA family protein